MKANQTVSIHRQYFRKEQVALTCSIFYFSSHSMTMATWWISVSCHWGVIVTETSIISAVPKVFNFSVTDWTFDLIIPWYYCCGEFLEINVSSREQNNLLFNLTFISSDKNPIELKTFITRLTWPRKAAALQLITKKTKTDKQKTARTNNNKQTRMECITHTQRSAQLSLYLIVPWEPLSNWYSRFPQCSPMKIQVHMY